MADNNTPKYIDGVDGSISYLSQNVYEELVTTGYSMIFSDVENAIIGAVKSYVGWNGELRSMYDLESDDLMSLFVDGTTVLTIDEWAIIKPVVMAHCEVIQSKRMEGVQNLGVQPVGVASSEAKQLYKEAVEQMKKEAFDCEPFTVVLDTDTSSSSYSTSNASNFWWWWC